jgi:CheY-like chemotaxis protein
MIRVLLADDQPIVRTGLRTILDLADDIDIVGEAADGAQALAMTYALTPDVVVMDIRMPALDGIEATRQLTRSASTARVLILTTYGLDEYVYQARARAGSCSRPIPPGAWSRRFASSPPATPYSAPPPPDASSSSTLPGRRRPAAHRPNSPSSPTANERSSSTSPAAGRTTRLPGRCTSWTAPSRPTSPEYLPSSACETGHS